MSTRTISASREIDWLLAVLVLAIPACGLVVLYSAGFDRASTGSKLWGIVFPVASLPFLKQSLFLLLGLAAMGVGLFLPVEWLKKGAYPVYGVSLILLVLVSLFGVVSNGSRRWLSLGVVNLQPAEFMKLGVILALARFLSRHTPPAGGYSWGGLVRPVAIFLVPMALIVKQPDLGTGLVVGAIGGMMLLFLGVRLRVLALSLLIGGILVIPVWYKLHDYQRNRIISLFNPDFDPKGTGYHINQSKIAVGSGELLGKGFMRGSQTQLEFLPEHTTDFVFSVLAEEWGFVGCLGVMMLYFAVLQRMLRLGGLSKDLFSSLVIFGIFSVLFFHICVNIGMVVGVLPVVGIPLPLFSYGGSSVIATLFSIGLALGLGSKRKRYGASI